MSLKGNPIAKKEISKRTIIKGVIALLVAGVAVYSSITLLSNYSDISRLNAQAKAYSVQLDDQNKENAKLEAVLDADDKNEYIEQKAREKGYVKSGETVFYDISSSK